MESKKTKLILLVLTIILLVASASLGVRVWQQYSHKDLSAELIEEENEDETLRKEEDDITESNELSFVQGEEVTQDLVRVNKVVDGDTIIIEGNKTIRYIGIDTPETVDPRRPVGCYGKEASNMNKKLLEGKHIRLEKDISETDKYDRLLRYVFLPTENGELFVNDYLVRQGYAKSSSYPPDIKYQQQFVEAQQEAQQENKGLWGACKK